jgi:cholesterol transport system auxiliary component
MKRSFVLFGIVVLLLGSCTLTPKDRGQAYMFSLGPAKASGQPHTGARLIVELPATAPELDTHRISLIRDKGIRDYYAGAKWADFLPVLVQDSLVRTLDSSGLFKAVAPDQTGLAPDMALKVEIRDFQAEYAKAGLAPVVRVRLVATLISREDGRTVASLQTGPVTRKAASDSLPAIHAAFRAAFLAAQQRLTEELNRELMDKRP